MTESVSDEEAVAIYRRYWTSDTSQERLALEFSRARKTVAAVVNRDRHAEATAEAARELGHPEEEPRG